MSSSIGVLRPRSTDTPMPGDLQSTRMLQNLLINTQQPQPQTTSGVQPRPVATSLSHAQPAMVTGSTPDAQSRLTATQNLMTDVLVPAVHLFSVRHMNAFSKRHPEFDWRHVTTDSNVREPWRFQQCTLNSQNQFVFEINRLSVPSTMLASVNDILSHFQEHHTLPTPRVEISLLCTILLRVSYRSPLAIAAPFANPRDYFVDNPGHHSGDSAAMTLTQASRDQYMERLLESEFDRETIRHVQELRRRFSIGVRVRTAASPHGAVDDFEDLAFRIYHVLVRLLGGDVDEVKDPEELALFRRLEELRDECES